MQNPWTLSIRSGGGGAVQLMQADQTKDGFIGGPSPDMAVMAACDWRPQIRLGHGIHLLATLIRLLASLYNKATC